MATKGKKKRCVPMGGGSSTAKPETKPSVSSPEISGKGKFLATPVTGEIIHPETNDRWFLLCFSPLSFNGLVFVARNSTNASALLVKEVTDAQLTMEKESQKISMSWNVFFKALSSEFPKANKGGSSCTFTDAGDLEIETKIALTGAAAQAKKPDLYRCTLSKVDATPNNIFRFVVAPLCVQFGKKRTDLVDRPDPQKERTFSENEAAASFTHARLQSAERIIQDHEPSIEDRKSVV